MKFLILVKFLLSAFFYVIFIRTTYIYSQMFIPISPCQHFHLALLDTNPSSLSPLETRFHIGHLYEVQGKFTDAKEMYEAILATENVPAKVRIPLPCPSGFPSLPAAPPLPSRLPFRLPLPCPSGCPCPPFLNIYHKYISVGCRDPDLPRFC